MKPRKSLMPVVNATGIGFATTFALVVMGILATPNVVQADPIAWDSRIEFLNSLSPKRRAEHLAAEEARKEARRKAEEARLEAIRKAEEARTPVFQKLLWNEYARYVQSHTTVNVFRDGRWHIATKFSNGNRMAPHSMSVFVEVVGRNDSVIFKALQEVTTLHPSFGGRATEFTVDDYGKLTKSEIANIHDVRVRFSNVTQEMLDDFTGS